MDQGVSISISGMDELTDDLKDLLNTYPKEAANLLVKEAKSLRKDYVHKLRAEAKTLSGSDKSLGKLKNLEWKKRGNGETVRVDIGSLSPHFHLYERGHNLKIPSSGYTGYVEGRFTMQHVAEKYEDELPEVATQLLDSLLRREKLI